MRLLGSAGTGVRVKMRQDGRGKEVRTAKSNLPNLSPICLKTGRISIYSSLPHWLAGLRTGLDDYERGLCQR